jgi:hypothetical protein
MLDELLELLKEVFKGDKGDTTRWLATKGYSTWNEVKNADNDQIRQLTSQLASMRKRQYITYQVGIYTFSRPKDIQNVSELSWSIRGLKL